MNILVIDDSAIHQASARQTLEGHNLTVATSYEKGFRILTPLMRDMSKDSVEKNAKGPCYDVVLSDLLMPATGMMMGPDAMKFVGEEQPLGWALVLRAVLNGARYAAIVSDVNHHDHPAAYALEAIDNAWDSWGDTKYQRGLPKKKPQFVINGAVVGFFQAPSRLTPGFPGCNWKCNEGKNARGEICELCKGTGLKYGKDWGKVLEVLLEQPGAG